MTIDAFLSQYGAFAVFLGAGIEGETVVVGGGLLAHQGLIPLTHVMIAAATGSFLADQAFFQVGRRFRDHPRVRRIAARPAFSRALRLLEDHPVAFVLMFRFLYGLRTISPIAIGTTSLSARAFVCLNAVAAIVWGIAFSALGYVFGHGLEMAFGRLRPLVHIVIPVAVIALAVVTLRGLIRGSFGKSDQR